jgi:hypothetical protein
MRAASTDSARPPPPSAVGRDEGFAASGHPSRRPWRRAALVIAAVVAGHLSLIDRMAISSHAVPGHARPPMTARWLTPPAHGEAPDPTAAAPPTAKETGADQPASGGGAALAPTGAELPPPTDPYLDAPKGSSTAAAAAASVSAADPAPGTAARDGKMSDAVLGDAQAQAGQAPASASDTSLRQPAGAWLAGGRLPVYPTRPPPPFAMRFSLQRADLAGQARLDWRSDGATYTLHFEGDLNGKALVEQTSRGGFDLAGLAPLRLADQRAGRDLPAANFRRGVGRISFSGPTVEYELLPDAQDRLSWLVQLAAISAAAHDASRPDQPLGDLAQVALLVVDARGVAAIWLLNVVGAEPVTTAAGPVAALHLVREPLRAYDLKVEVWLDPAQHHLPLRLRQTVVPGGETLTWERVSVEFGPR